MQTITITGYLSKDAETSTTRDGTEVTRWNVPVRQGWGDNERTNWFRVSIWGKRAEFAAKAGKGEFVAVTGDLTISEWEGKPQYKIRATDFQSVRTAPRDDRGERKQPYGGGGNAYAEDDLDSDIPFITAMGMF